MPDPAPYHPASDRNLLFGLLALQMDFIGRDALIAAMHAWILDKAKSLGDILQGQGALALDDRAVLDALVDRHLRKHGGDPERSLAAVASAGSAGSVSAALRRLADPDLDASLARVGAAPDPDALAGTGNRTVDQIGPDRAHGSTVDHVGDEDASLCCPVRYRVLRPHARGGLGEVFVAEDKELHREVALKEIQARLADDPTSRARFLREAEVTGRLEHPGIVPVYGLGTYADGRPFYAMRFIKGDNLKEAADRFHADESLRSNPGRRSLGLRQLLRRFTDVCNAIEYAHSRGVLHRDIKPGNIIVGKHGETLVVDWGLAKAVGHIDPRVDADEWTLIPSSASGSAET